MQLVISVFGNHAASRDGDDYLISHKLILHKFSLLASKEMYGRQCVKYAFWCWDVKG